MWGTLARCRNTPGERKDDLELLAVRAASFTLTVMASVAIVCSLDLLHSGSHSKATKTCPRVDGRQLKLNPESWSLLKSEFGLHRQETVPQADLFVR